jgi:hypothetical protein
MPTTPLRAQLRDQELPRREHARPTARRTLLEPARVARAMALAICEVEAGLRSASQLERLVERSMTFAVEE